MKNHFDISDSIEIREVDIAGVACICAAQGLKMGGGGLRERPLTENGGLRPFMGKTGFWS